MASNDQDFQDALAAGEIDDESATFFLALIDAIESDELVWATWLFDPNTGAALAAWAEQYKSDKVVDFISLPNQASQLSVLLPYSGATPAFHFVDESLKLVVVGGWPSPDLENLGWISP